MNTERVGINLGRSQKIHNIFAKLDEFSKQEEIKQIDDTSNYSKSNSNRSKKLKFSTKGAKVRELMTENVQKN